MNTEAEVARARLGEVSANQSRPVTRLEQLLNQMEETRQYTKDTTSLARRSADALAGAEPQADEKYPEVASGGSFIDRFAEAVDRQHKAIDDLSRQVRRLQDADLV